MKKLIFLPLIFFVLLASRATAQEFSLQESIDRGKSVYSSNCSSCHMVNGAGISGVYPSLKGPDSLLQDTPRLVRSVLKGFPDTTESQYKDVKHRYSLSDQQVADVLNYIRNSWGNEAEPITPGEVQPALKDGGEEE